MHAECHFSARWHPGRCSDGLPSLASDRLHRSLAAQTIYTPYQFITIAGTAGTSGQREWDRERRRSSPEAQGG